MCKLCDELVEEAEATLKIECGNCGAEMTPKEAFCQKCGYPVDAEKQKKWYSDMGKLMG